MFNKAIIFLLPGVLIGLFSSNSLGMQNPESIIDLYVRARCDILEIKKTNDTFETILIANNSLKPFNVIYKDSYDFCTFTNIQENSPFNKFQCEPPLSRMAPSYINELKTYLKQVDLEYFLIPDPQDKSLLRQVIFQENQIPTKIPGDLIKSNNNCSDEEIDAIMRDPEQKIEEKNNIYKLIDKSKPHIPRGHLYKWNENEYNPLKDDGSPFALLNIEIDLSAQTFKVNGNDVQFINKMYDNCALIKDEKTNLFYIYLYKENNKQALDFIPIEMTETQFQSLKEAAQNNNTQKEILLALAIDNDKNIYQIFGCDTAKDLNISTDYILKNLKQPKWNMLKVISLGLIGALLIYYCVQKSNLSLSDLNPSKFFSQLGSSQTTP